MNINVSVSFHSVGMNRSVEMVATSTTQRIPTECKSEIHLRKLNT
jgi:hypothetical protein